MDSSWPAVLLEAIHEQQPRSLEGPAGAVSWCGLDSTAANMIGSRTTVETTAASVRLLCIETCDLKDERRA